MTVNSSFKPIMQGSSFALILAATSLLLAEQPGAAEPPEWSLVEIPAAWKTIENKSGAEDGFREWYRCVVKIPTAWRGQKLKLFCEAIDDAREVFFNGQLLGTLGSFPPEYRSGLGKSMWLPIDDRHVLFGQLNVVAIRIFHKQGRTGFNVAAPVVFGENEAIRLRGAWESVSGDDLQWAKLSTRDQVSQEAMFAQLDDAQQVTKTLKKLDDEEGPLTVDETIAAIATPDDLQIHAVLGDDDIGQPLSFKFDERGRLWVMQYLQYPSPAGLTMVSRDKFLRSVYDQVPAPPPDHFRGRDKITIHEDKDQDGYFETQQTFVDGLSLATSFARGRGGVWVLNPPYLLFYPDRDQNDVPDGNPEIHLEGFGLEDSHAVANSLRWGPDGWLYACQGSTVTAGVRAYGSESKPKHSMGQLIWRYHPEKRQYEIFAEGGGNAFGIEIDSRGRIYSGHNAGNTRGFHYVQGGYYQRGFGKHGALSNPYAFGYFPPMKHPDVERFSHDFVIYEDVLLPDSYHRKLFAVEPLAGRIVYSRLQPTGSTFASDDVAYAFESNDKWVRPVDIDVGPDGAIYVADFYEQRIDHASHHQGRVHRASGRIYRLGPTGQSSSHPIVQQDLSALETAELIGRLMATTHRWEVDTLLRLLGDRRDTTAIEPFQKAVDENGQFALRALWGLHLCGGLSEPQALKLLAHPDPYVRLWTIRLVCDDREASMQMAEQLAQLALDESHVEVRCQLACSARRLPASQGLQLVRNLARHDVDTKDSFIPLLLWWAMEEKIDSDPKTVLALFDEPAFWKLSMVKETILPRLLRRFAATGRRTDLVICAKILRLPQSRQNTKVLLAGFEQAYQGRSLADLPDELVAAMAEVGGGSLALRLRQGSRQAIDEALAVISDDEAALTDRIQYVEVLGQIRRRDCVVELMALCVADVDNKLRAAALTALGEFSDQEIARHLVENLGDFEGDTLEVVQTLLASRRVWTLELLTAVERGDVSPQLVTLPTVRKMLLHQDARVGQLVNKHWGSIEGAPTAKMRTDLEHYKQVIGLGSGDPYAGKKLYMRSCGKCHKLFESGGEIGPDLTAFKRGDLRLMLVNVVNPSLEIREGYENHVIIANNGRILSGLIVDQDSQVVVLKSADGQRTVIPRDDIEDITATARSLMPEGLLTPLNEQEIRDLFAYLRSTQPQP